MKLDFHCHTNYSDGALSASQLIDYAMAREITLLGLTDHDSTDGVTEANDYIQQQQLAIQLIAGVEISAMTDFGEVHIVGLGIDPLNSDLQMQLRAQQQKRWQRAQEICDKLEKLGVKGVLAYLRQHVKQVVTRTHIAEAIVALGFAKDREQAFKRFIGKRGKIKVAKQWISMDESIDLIKKAGGTSILAHPTRYPLSNRKLGFLIESFAAFGGEGLELSYPSLNKDKMQWLEIHREKNHLFASAGSDFHYPNLRWTDLGRFPNFGVDLNPLLTRLSLLN